MARTPEIKDAQPYLSYEEIVKVLLYNNLGSMWIQNLERNELERSMEGFKSSLNLRG